MQGAWRRLGALVAPSAFAAAAAAVLAGLVEGAAHSYSALTTVATAGVTAMLAIPLGLVAALVVRALWAGWRPAQLAAALTEEGGGAPRLAAWLLYVGGAALALPTLVFQVMAMVLVRTATPIVLALTAMLASLVLAAVFVVLSRPVVELCAPLLRRLDRAARLPGGRSAMRPAILLAGGLVFALAAAYLAWRASVRPRIGHLDLGILLHPAVFAVVCAAGHAAWPAIARRRRGAIALSGVAVAVAVTLAAALFVRNSRPLLLLEIWGEPSVAGRLIDMTHDIDELRREIALGGIAPGARHSDEQPDVVLITIDTVRADRTPLHGGPVPMPALAQLGRRGVVFDWVMAPGNVTRRSLPTTVLGLSPHRVRGRVAGWALKLDPRHITLTERLRAGGYETAGFFCCRSFFAPEHQLGLDRGFDHLVLEYDGAKLSQQTVEWLERRRELGGDKPLFLWMHFIEPHNWAQRPDRGGAPREQPARTYWLYDRTLRDVDSYLSTVIGAVNRSDNPHGTVIVVTSDHGEELGDRGHQFHSSTLYNDQIRVPLVIAGPGIRHGRFPGAVGLVEVTPTILDLAGFEPPGMPGMDGVSLAPYLRGDRPLDEYDGDAYSMMVRDRSVERGARALVHGRYKVIWHDGEAPQLYDLEDDPDEQDDLAASRPEVLEAMVERLARRAELDLISPF